MLRDSERGAFKSILIGQSTVCERARYDSVLHSKKDPKEGKCCCRPRADRGSTCCCRPHKGGEMPKGKCMVCHQPVKTKLGTRKPPDGWKCPRCTELSLERQGALSSQVRNRWGRRRTQGSVPSTQYSSDTLFPALVSTKQGPQTFLAYCVLAYSL